MRLDRFLATQLAASRTGVARLVRHGRVTVDGEVVRDRGAPVTPGRSRVAVDGEPVAWQEHLTLLLHKPPGLVTATRADDDRTVMELVPRPLRRKDLAPAGRLDRDTTGLLVLTTDGALNHALTHPRRHVPRTYLAAVEGRDGDPGAPPPSDARDVLMAAFAEGVTLADGTRCRPAEARWEDPGAGGPATLRVTLHEGRYHQVKRMVAACGGRVVALRRVAIGALALPPDLPEGACRVATEDEIVLLRGAEGSG